MGKPSVLAGAERVEPSRGERESVTAAHAAVTAAPGAELVLRHPDGTFIPLPPLLTRLVAASLRELAAGPAVTMLPSVAMLTPAEAGELLGLLRPFISRLLDAGEIPSERLPHSRHRRVRLSDVLAFQERVIVRSGRRSVSSAAAITAAVRKFFPDSEVPFDSYADLVAGMPGKDPDDRVHMAAAIAGHATHIITHNLAGFPPRGSRKTVTGGIELVGHYKIGSSWGRRWMVGS